MQEIVSQRMLIVGSLIVVIDSKRNVVENGRVKMEKFLLFQKIQTSASYSVGNLHDEDDCNSQGDVGNGLDSDVVRASQ